MTVRPIDGNKLVQSLKNRRLHILMENENDGAAVFDDIVDWIKYTPTLSPNEPLTWEELKAETKINPVYSVKYGWVFPSTVKDEPYKQIWFFTSKGFAQTELFYRDTFYRRPPEGDEDT